MREIVQGWMVFLDSMEVTKSEDENSDRANLKVTCHL